MAEILSYNVDIWTIPLKFYNDGLNVRFQKKMMFHPEPPVATCVCRHFPRLDLHSVTQDS